MNSQEITSGEMTGRQRKQLIELITNALDVTKQNVAAIIDGLDLQDNEAQEIIEKGNLQELFQNVVVDLLKKPAVIGKHFNVSILKLISGTERLLVDACDGKETIAKAREVFPSGIDGDFINWGTNKAGIVTKEAEVQVHELTQNATFSQIFGSLGTDLDKLCLTQSQIKNFCKKHCNWLRKDDNATFFLFKVEDQFFVASVHVDSGGLYVTLRRFGRDRIWNAESSSHVVVPQLSA